MSRLIRQSELSQQEQRGDEFAALAPAGYYIALRLGFAYPLVERNGFPTAWVDRYTRQSYMLSDPIMRWIYANTGAIRWSEITLEDRVGILADASRHGLRYGVAISVEDASPRGQRSFGTFCRADREFSDDEIAHLRQRLEALHIATAPPTNLTSAEIEALKMVQDGLLVKEIANRLGVTEGAIKQRLKGAKAKLGAKTASQAVSAAKGYGLI